jgi:hypothetical protein
MFLLSFTLFFGATSLLWIDAEWYVEGLGFLALSIESTIGFPQVYSNWKKGPAGLRSVCLSHPLPSPLRLQLTRSTALAPVICNGFAVYG